MKAKRDFSLPQAIIRVIGLSVPIKLFSGCRVRAHWIWMRIWNDFCYRYDKLKQNNSGAE